MLLLSAASRRGAEPAMSKLGQSMSRLVCLWMIGLCIVGCGKNPQEQLLGIWTLEIKNASRKPSVITTEYARDGTVYNHKNGEITRWGKWSVEGDVLQKEIGDDALASWNALEIEIASWSKRQPVIHEKTVTRRRFFVKGDELRFYQEDGIMGQDVWKRRK